ncbi:MAG: hypothetical protein IPH49_16170 [Ignavibacteria bacterium]|nr:hypothetical protein [Ignavibacteria bacterium]
MVERFQRIEDIGVFWAIGHRPLGCPSLEFIECALCRRRQGVATVFLAYNLNAGELAQSVPGFFWPTFNLNSAVVETANVFSGFLN